MDPGQVLFGLIRVYVWLLFGIGITTVAVIFLPRAELTAPLAGIWFAVGGYGAIVLVTGLLTVLVR